MIREFLDATASGDLERLAKSLAGNVALVRDGDNLGAMAPDPIHGAAGVSDFLIQKIQAHLSLGTNIRKSRFRDVPLLLAYRGAKLVNAFALVLRAGRIQTVYLVNCPVRLRSIAAQTQESNGEGSPL